MSTPDSTLGGELADLQRAYEKAQRSEVEMRLAIARLIEELNRSLGVLVPLVDLMGVEAEERGVPAADLKDLAVLQRHLERLCRAAEVAIPAARPDRDGLFDPNALLRDAIALVADRFEQCGVPMYTPLEKGLPPIFGNPEALGQALISLLRNGSGPDS